MQELKADYEKEFNDFELFWYLKPMMTLKQFGLVSL